MSGIRIKYSFTDRFSLFPDVAFKHAFAPEGDFLSHELVIDPA